MASRLYLQHSIRLSMAFALRNLRKSASLGLKWQYPLSTEDRKTSLQHHRFVHGESNGQAQVMEEYCNISTYRFDEASRMVHLDWEDGKVAVFPSIFLRDNCQCPLCFHPSSKQRLLDTARTVDLRIKPSSLSIRDHGKCIRILWEDEHQSDFSTEWLRNRIFPKSSAEVKARNVMGLKPLLWGSELEGNIPEFDFVDVLKDGKTQYSWFYTLATTGVALLVNAPAKSGQLPLLAKHSVGYLRPTNYGECYSVKRKQQPSNLAYTVNCLPLHTDLPYYEYQPGIQLLHCIEQSGEGGDSHLVDGFRIANIIKEKYPEAFNLLTRVPFSFTDIGADCHGEFLLQFESPMIRLDQFNNVEAINHNNHVRDSFVNAPADDVKKAYEAYYLLVKLSYEKGNTVYYKMREGDILTFNNKRVLHGRTAYNADKSSRWLEGGYFDWDEARSRMRVLAKLHGIAIPPSA